MYIEREMRCAVTNVYARGEDVPGGLSEHVANVRSQKRLVYYIYIYIIERERETEIDR